MGSGHHGNYYNERCDQLATEAMSGELREDIGYSFATTHNFASRGGVVAISINIPEDISIPWITADASQISCKSEIEFFTTIYHPTFRDYAKLKTGGIDLVSKLQLGYFQEHFPKEIFETIKKYFSNPKDVLAVLRCYEVVEARIPESLDSGSVNFVIYFPFFLIFSSV